MKFIPLFVIASLCRIVSGVSAQPLDLDFEDDELTGWFGPPAIKDYQVKLTSYKPHGGKQCVEIYSVEDEPKKFGNVMQYLDAKPYRGKRITYKAYVRSEAEPPGGNAQLWLRVDRKSKKMGFFDNMSDRPITSSEWKEYTITGIVEDDARGIAIGCIMHGEGRIFIDDASVTISDVGPSNRSEQMIDDGQNTLQVLPTNLDFEGPEFGTKKGKGWTISKGLTSYKVKLSAHEPHGGSQCAKIVSVGSNRLECGTVTQAIDATPYRGKRITVKAFARADIDEDIEGWGSLFLRFRSPGDFMLYNQKGDQRITLSQWGEYSVSGVVGNDAETIEFGCGLFRQGAVYLDDVSFTCEDCK